MARYVGDLLSAAARLAGPSVEFTAVLLRLGRRRSRSDVSDLQSAGVLTRERFPPLDHAFYVATRLFVPVPFEVVLPRQDIFFYPNFRRYATLGKPTIAAIYDLSYLMSPESVHPRFIRQLKYIAPQAIRRSDVVMTISETVAGEIAEAYPETSSRLRVIPPGRPVSLPADPPPDWRERLGRLGLSPDYLLHVGTLEPRKNLTVLIEAMRLLPEAIAACHPLVLVGQRGWSESPVLQTMHTAGSRVRHLEYLSDLDLRAVYYGAALLVFPSRYEGFGLPVLEAMSLGLPVACSDIPVLREVGGGATVHFDHRRPDHISEAIAELLADEGRRRDMAAMGCRRAADFSWDRSATAFLDVIRELASD